MGLLSATVLTRDLLPFAERCNAATTEHAPAAGRPAFERGHTLDVPLLQGATWSYECEVLHTVPLGECHTYFATVRGVNLSPAAEALDFIDLNALSPVVYSPMHYYAVGEHLGRIGDFSK